MTAEMKLFTGKLTYREKEFHFVFDKRKLKLIPHQINEQDQYGE